MYSDDPTGFIKHALGKGMTDDEIRTNLRNMGLDDGKIQNVLVSVKNEVSGQPSPEVPQPPPPSPQPSPESPKLPPEPITQVEETPKEAKSFMASKIFSFRPSKKAVIIGSVVLVVVGAVVAVSFMPQQFKFLRAPLDFLNNINPFSSAPYAPDEIISAFAKSGTIDSARYDIKLYIETQDKDPNLRPLVIDLPEGELPDDLEKALNYYYYDNSIFSPRPIVDSGASGSKEPRQDNAIVVEIPELKSVLDAKARDSAKIRLVSSILSELKAYYTRLKVDPDTVAELQSAWGPAEGKYFNYTPAVDKKSFKLSITLESQESVDALKDRIDDLKSGYNNYQIDDSAIKFENRKVTFTERFVNYAYHLYIYPTSGYLATELTSLFSDSSYSSYIPGSFKLNLNIGGIAQGKNSENDGFYLQLGGKADFEDLVVEADAEFTNVGSDSFIKINKFPSILFDVSKIRGEWIQLSNLDDKDDYSGSELYYLDYIGEELEKSKESNDRYYEQMNKLVLLAEKEKVITAEGSPVKEELNGKKAYKYSLTIDEEKLPGFYEQLASELKEFGSDAFIKKTDEADAFVSSAGFKEIVKYLKDVSDLYIWVDSNGYIVKTEYDLKYLPPDPENAGVKQLHITVAVELSNINEDLKVERPTDYIELKEVVSELFGVDFEKQLSTSRNTQRWSNVNTLLNGTGQRLADNKGNWPTTGSCKALPTTTKYIGTEEGNYDLASCIVPTYLPILVQDPSDGSTGNTGYTIYKDNKTGKITITAPRAEGGESISVTR